MPRSTFGRARVGWALAAVCALACDGGATDSRAAARVRYSYVITPAGTLHRVFAAGPITRGANSRVGLQIAYLAQTTDPAQLDREADELVGVFGPELLLTPERTLRVEARQRTTEQGFRPIGPARMYERKDAVWLRAGREDAAGPQPTAAGEAKRPDERSFPFDREKLDAATAEATRWLGLIDQELPAADEQLSDEFASKLTAAPTYWQSLLATRRSLGLPAPRVELYRMQSLDRDPKLAPGDNVMVQYRATPPTAAAVLERITMRREKDRWVVAGYLVQPIDANPSPR